LTSRPQLERGRLWSSALLLADTGLRFPQSAYGVSGEDLRPTICRHDEASSSGRFAARRIDRPGINCFDTAASSVLWVVPLARWRGRSEVAPPAAKAATRRHFSATPNSGASATRKGRKPAATQAGRALSSPRIDSAGRRLVTDHVEPLSRAYWPRYQHTAGRSRCAHSRRTSGPEGHGALNRRVPIFGWRADPRNAPAPPKNRRRAITTGTCFRPCRMQGPRSPLFWRARRGIFAVHGLRASWGIKVWG